MAGLYQRGVCGALGGFHPRHPTEELANRHGVCGVVRPLIDHFQHIVFANHAGGELNAAGSPAIGHGHFTAAKRHW